MIIFTKPNCPYCDNVKQIQNVVHEDYMECVVGVDIATEVFKFLFPEATTVPVIVYDEGTVDYDNYAEYRSNILFMLHNMAPASEEYKELKRVLEDTA